MASPADARRQAVLGQRQSEALGLAMALRDARQELDLILGALRQHRLGDGEEELPEALVMNGARLQDECEELEAALRRARAGCAGLVHGAY